MTVKITKFNAHNTAFSVSVVLVIVSFILALLVGLFQVISAAPGHTTYPFINAALSILFPPIAWGVGTYVTVFVVLWIYNRISHIAGFIEFEISKSDL